MPEQAVRGEDFSSAFKLAKNGSIHIETEEAVCTVFSDEINIKAGRQSYQISYRDIQSARAENYHVFIELKNGDRADIYYLGHQFDSFCESFFSRYNSLVKNDSFMGEEAVCIRREANYEYKGKMQEKGECDIYLTGHSVIVQRIYGNPAMIPYALIDFIDYRQYDFSIHILVDEWKFSMLGHEYDGFRTQYSRFYEMLVKQAGDWLISIKNDIPSPCLRPAAELFLDGRPVSEDAADQVNRGLWRAILDKACELSGAGTFDYLYQNTKEKTIGFKDSLCWTDGLYIWMMAEMGEYIVYEAVSSTDASMATYLYRIQSSSAETMSLINYCMHMTEFRREPVFLTDEQLQKPENAAYKDAVLRVPELGILRSLYGGRLIHTSADNWIQSLKAKINNKP